MLFAVSVNADGKTALLLANGQAWQSLGFAVGQQVYITGVGVRTIVGFDNSGTPDGAQWYPGGRGRGAAPGRRLGHLQTSTTTGSTSGRRRSFS